MKNRIISPSLLSADFSMLGDQIEVVKKSGAERLHLDVMDGHFVPNFTFGPFIVKAIRKLTNLHLETHLMISNPEDYIDDFADAGSDTIIFHYEASKNISRDLSMIKKHDKLAGIAINPDTDPKLLEQYFKDIDYVLVMSVFPGFGGQSFIESTLETMKYLSSYSKKYNFVVGVDGGVNLSTISKVYETGVDITIVGSALYGAQDINKRFNDLMTV